MRSPYGSKRPRRLVEDPEFLRGVVYSLRFLAAGFVSTAQRRPPKKVPVIRYKKRRRLETPHG